MKYQKGGVAVEFALLALLFFMLVFSAIEIGRWFFIWNTLVEGTRRGARIAAVCPFNDPYIKIATVFGDPNGPDAQPSPFIQGFDTSDVSIFYYQIDAGSGNPPTTGSLTLVNNPESAAQGVQDDIKMVRVQVNFNHTFLAPVIGALIGPIQAPSFSTLLPLESRGTLQESPNLCY